MKTEHIREALIMLRGRKRVLDKQIAAIERQVPAIMQEPVLLRHREVTGQSWKTK